MQVVLRGPRLQLVCAIIIGKHDVCLLPCEDEGPPFLNTGTDPGQLVSGSCREVNVVPWEIIRGGWARTRLRSR